MNIHESAEDYLEKILMLQEQKGSVRSIDIAVAMGFSKPSVSVAMKNLRENGYISMDPDGFIKLEQPGMEIAQRIYGRHRKLTAFFVALGVDPDVAAKDACKVEQDDRLCGKSRAGKAAPVKSPAKKACAPFDAHAFCLFIFSARQGSSPLRRTAPAGRRQMRKSAERFYGR